MPDFMGPSQVMGQQLQGVLQSAVETSADARMNIARRQMQQQEMAKKMELDFQLADKLMPVNKELALEHFNRALAPMGRSVDMENFDVSHTIFSQAAELKQKGDLVGMQTLLKESNKYLINLGDRQKAMALQQEAQQGIAGQQAQTIQGLQAENPQLNRSRQLISMAGMVGNDLTKIDPDQLAQLTGSADPTEQRDRLVQAQAMVEGHEQQTKHLTSLFAMDPSAFGQAAHQTAQAIANPEVLARGRISDLLQKTDPTDLDQRELMAKVSVYGSPALQAAMQIKTAQRDAEMVRAQLEDTQGRLAALQTHREAYDGAMDRATSLTNATKGLPSANGPLTDEAAKTHLLAEGTRSIEGQTFLAKNQQRIQSLEQTAQEADQQRADLKQRLLTALPGQREVVASQLKEFESMASANKAMARLLKSENPYIIEQQRADLDLLTDPYDKKQAQSALTELENQRAKDLSIVENERTRLERREKILRGKQPEADRKAEEEANLRQAHTVVDKLVARGASLTGAVQNVADNLGVSKKDLAKSVMEARGAGVPEAQIQLLSAAQQFKRANGRDPEPGEVNGMLLKVLKAFPGVKGDDIMPVLKDVNRPGVQVSLYDTKQNVGDAGKLANVNQSIQELQQVRQVLTNPDGTINRAQLAGGSTGVPFTKGRGAFQMLEKAVEIKLRAATGAAARPEEMKMYMRLFAPSNLDSDDTIKYKLDSFENWLQTVADTTDPLGSLRQRADEMLNEGTVGLLQTPEYKELRGKFPQASASDIVKFLRKRGK